MAITALCKRCTLACVFIWVVRPSLTTLAMGMACPWILTCFFSSLLSIHFKEGFWVTRRLGFMYLCLMRNTFRLLVWFIFPALFLGLFCEFVCATGRAQHLPSGWDVTLTTVMPAWRLWLHLPKGLHLAHDILKVTTLSFQIPKGTSNETETRILKCSFTICGESEKKLLLSFHW